MALHKICKYLSYPKMIPFVVTNLTANFFGFSVLPGKVYADVINGLQHRVDKMQTNSEMYAKYGHAIYFWEKYDYKNRLSNNCTINEPKMVHFQDAFTDLYDNFLVMTWTLCMPGELWILGFIWPKKIMVTKYQPRTMIFVLTWYNLISLISHCLVYRLRFNGKIS